LAGWSAWAGASAKKTAQAIAKPCVQHAFAQAGFPPDGFFQDGFFQDAFKNKALAKRIAPCNVELLLPHRAVIRMVATGLRMVFKGIEHVNLSPHSMAKS
jgi:hypothetical protein